VGFCTGESRSAIDGHASFDNWVPEQRLTTGEMIPPLVIPFVVIWTMYESAAPHRGRWLWLWVHGATRPNASVICRSEPQLATA
jgi:hypothetical protein